MPRIAAHRPDEAKDARRIHGVRVERERRVGLGPLFGLQDVEGAGRATAPDRVDENRGIVAAEERVGEVHPPNAEVPDGDRLGPRALEEPPRDRDAEAVVAEKDVAHTGHEDARRSHGNLSTSSVRKKNRCPGCPARPRSCPGSSSTVTVTYACPSKSSSIDATVAARPASARSK